MPESKIDVNDNNHFVLSEREQKEISDFISKKRFAIINELAKNKRLSHGELAKATNTSVASLSNILIKFEQFNYQLIDSVTSGRYRYYFLTDLGNAYIDKCLEEERNLENEKIIQHEVYRLLQEAKECLEKFQASHEDDWEILLDDELIMRMNCDMILVKKNEVLIDKFIENIEKIILVKDDTLIEKVLKLLSCNVILRERLVNFLDKFMPFVPLLIKLENEENILQVYEIFEAAIEGNTKKVEEEAKKIGWIDKEYNAFTVAICEIVDHINDQDSQNIYSCFCQFLAGDKQLCAFLTRVTERTFENRPI